MIEFYKSYLLTGTWSKFKTDEEGNLTNNSSQINEDDPYLTFDGVNGPDVQLDISQDGYVLVLDCACVGNVFVPVISE